MIAPGQSGDVFSRHAADFLRRWRDGGYVTLLPPRHAASVMELTVAAP